MSKTLTEQKLVYLGDGYVGIKEESYNTDNTIQNFKTNEYKEFVSNSYELVQKIHILNEQNTKQYNELCEEIKKNNTLEKRLAIATKALRYYAQCKHINLDLVTIRDDCAEFEAFEDGEHARKALTKMEGVK